MKQIVLLGVASLLLLSCRHTRQIARSSFPVEDTASTEVKTESLSAEEMAFNSKLLNGIHKNHLDFTTFSAKLKIDFENDKQKQQNISTNIRMQKDSVIWISVSAPIIARLILPAAWRRRCGRRCGGGYRYRSRSPPESVAAFKACSTSMS